MADFGLYTALRGGDNWAQKRADESMEMQLSERMRQQSEQKMEANTAAQQYMQQYFDQIGQLDVLEKDQERINGVEKQARQNIIAGITRFNGDLRRYMATGGVMDLGQYKNSVMNSEVTKNAMRNKANYAQMLKAKAEGKFLLPVSMQVSGKDADGKAVQRTEYISPDQQLRLFDEGKITSLDFAGAEDKVNVDMMDFKDKYKDSKDPYSRNNIVQESEIYTVAIGKGASEAQARALANKYGSSVNQGGQAWYWGAGDIQKLNLEKQRVSQGWSRLAFDKQKHADAQEKDRKQNIFFSRAMNLQDGQQSPNLEKVEAGQIEGTMGITPIKHDLLGNAKRLSLGQKAFIFTKDGRSEPVDMTQSVLASQPQLARKGNDLYLKYTASHGRYGDVAYDSWLPGGMGDAPHEKYGNAVGFNDDLSTWTSDVYIPITNEVMDQYSQAIYQMKYPKGGDVEMPASGTINQEMLFNQGAQNIVGGGQ